MKYYQNSFDFQQMSIGIIELWSFRSCQLSASVLMLSKQRCAEWSLVWESQNTRSCYNPASRLKLYWGFRNSKVLVIWIFPADGALLNWWLNGIYSFLKTFPSLVKVLDEQLCVWSLKWNINRLSIKAETLYHPQEILRGFPCPSIY